MKTQTDKHKYIDNEQEPGLRNYIETASVVSDSPNTTSRQATLSTNPWGPIETSIPSRKYERINRNRLGLPPVPKAFDSNTATLSPKQ